MITTYLTPTKTVDVSYSVGCLYIVIDKIQTTYGLQMYVYPFIEVSVQYILAMFLYFYPRIKLLQLFPIHVDTDFIVLFSHLVQKCIPPYFPHQHLSSFSLLSDGVKSINLLLLAVVHKTTSSVSYTHLDVYKRQS